MLWCHTSVSGYFWLYHTVCHLHSSFKQSQHPNIYESVPAPALSHHTYLAFFFLEDGFTRLLLTGLWEGRSLKRFNLVRGNCMVDPSLTNTSSLPPISTMLITVHKNHSPTQTLALSSAVGWTPCECGVNLSAAPVSLRADRKCCCKTSLRLGAVWRVCELSGAGMQEGVTTPAYINTSFTPVPSLAGDTPCLHAWWPPNLAQTRMFNAFKN